MRAGFVRTVFLISVSGLLACEDPLAPRDHTPSRAVSGPKVNAPSNTSATAVSHSRIDVSWQDNSSNEIGFEVHVSTTGASGPFFHWGSTSADVTSYSHEGLNSLSHYCYVVRASRRTGNRIAYSEFSPAVCATTPAPPVPAAPSEVDAWPGSSTEVWVTWTDNSDNEAGFLVERSLDRGSNWTTAGTSQNGYYILDGGRTSEEEVCYRVTAFNAGGPSEVSLSDCATPPRAPTNLTATPNETTGELVVEWLDNSSVEDGYELWLYGWDEWGYAYYYAVSLPPNTMPQPSTMSYQGSSSEGVYGVLALKDGGYSDWAFLPTESTTAPQNQTRTLRSLPSSAQRTPPALKTPSSGSRR